MFVGLHLKKRHSTNVYIMRLYISFFPGNQIKLKILLKRNYAYFGLRFYWQCNKTFLIKLWNSFFGTKFSLISLYLSSLLKGEATNWWYWVFIRHSTQLYSQTTEPTTRQQKFNKNNWGVHVQSTIYLLMLVMTMSSSFPISITTRTFGIS